MNICQEFNDKIVDLIGNNLSRREQKRFAEHMQDCPICQKEYEKIKALYGILKEDTVPIPDQGIFDRIKNNIRQREIPLRRSKVAKLAKILVPVFALTLLMLYVLRPEKTVEIAVPTSVLLEDETIARISLGGILNDQLIQDLKVIEDYLPIDVDEMLAEFSDEERSTFIEVLHEELSRLQEDA